MLDLNTTWIKEPDITISSQVHTVVHTALHTGILTELYTDVHSDVHLNDEFQFLLILYVIFPKPLFEFWKLIIFGRQLIFCSLYNVHCRLYTVHIYQQSYVGWDFMETTQQTYAIFFLNSYSSSFKFAFQRNWVFVTNYDFLISISLQPNAVDLRYLKL